MKRQLSLHFPLFLILLISSLLLSTPSLAQSVVKYQDYASKGGVSAVVQGTPSTNKFPQVFPGCTVTVYLTGTTTLATIYTNSSLTPKSNPFTADSEGRVEFYIAPGSYDIRYSGTGITTPFTRSAVNIGSGSGGGGSGVTTTLYNPLLYTCVGDGVTDDRNCLNTLVNTTIQPAGGRLLLSATFLINSNLSIPANVHIDGQSVGYIKVATGKTLTVLGSMPRFPLQYFTNCGPSLGTVDFTGNYKIVEVFPEWFGADASLADSAGYTTNYRALYAAIHSAFGNRASISAATNAATVQFTYTGAKISTGDTILISGATGNWDNGGNTINGSWTATATGDHTFTIPRDSTTFGPLTGTVVAHTRKNGVNTQFNRTLVLNGEYSINDEIPLYHVLGFSMQGGNQLNHGIRQRVNDKRIFAGESVAYGTFKNLRFSTSGTLSGGGLLEINYGATQGDDLRPQNITFQDCVFDGNSSALVGVWIAKSGGGSQGDNIRFLYCYGRSFTHSAILLGGNGIAPLTGSSYATNAIQVIVEGGDYQNNPKYAHAGYGGSFIISNVSYENQVLGSNGRPTQTGADVHCEGNSFRCKLLNSRSESLRVVEGEVDIENLLMSSNGWLQNWYDSNAATTLTGTEAYVGQLVSGSKSGGDGKVYRVTRADNVNTGYRTMTSITLPNVIGDSTGTYTVNELAGLKIYAQFQSNLFVAFAGTVVSNTATTITVDTTGSAYTLSDYTAGNTKYIVYYQLPIWGGVAKTTATGGSGTGSGATITKTGAGWTVNAFTGWRVSLLGNISSQKGALQWGIIASNTADTITLDATGWRCDYPLDYLHPDYQIVAADNTSEFCVEPNWGTTTTSGTLIDFAAYDYYAIDGASPGTNYHVGYIKNSNVGSGAMVRTLSTDIDGLQVSRADWNPAAGLWDDGFHRRHWKGIEVIRERGFQKPLPWVPTRNGSTSPLGPTPKVVTFGTDFITWNRGLYGGGSTLTDLGIGPGDGANANSTLNKDILAFAGGMFGKRSARGTNQTGLDLNLAPGAGTGSANGGNLNFYYFPAGSSGVTENTRANAWRISGSAGHLLGVTDNTFDIGANGATRPRTGYFGTSIVSPIGTFATSISSPKITNLTTNGLITTSSGDGTLGITVPATGILTFLATSSSANLASALTDETGTGATVFAGSPTFTGTTTMATAAPTNIVSTPSAPAQLTANTNDWAPTLTLIIRASSDAARNVTGLVAGTSGQVIYLWNVGAQNIVLIHESASSTTANRFLTSTGVDLTLAANKCALMFYDGTTARWRVALLP